MTNETITKRLKVLAELQAELNKLKETYQDMLESNPQYQAMQEETTKVKEENKDKKEKITDSPTYKSILDQMKEKKQEITENHEILSQELIEYYRENGTLEIEDEDGNVKRMKFSVKLISQ